MSRLYELIEELCPNGVRHITINELMNSLTTGLNPRKNFVLNEQGASQPYITGKDVFNNRINISDRTAKIKPEVVELINKRAKLQDKIILFASTGTGTVGRMAYIEEYDGTWNISETLYVINLKWELVVPKYFMYVVNSSYAKEQYEPKISKGSVPHLKIADLVKVKIPIPPIEVQQEIVNILDKYTSATEEIKSRLEEELDARKKQYMHLTSELIDKVNSDNIVNLEEVCGVYDGTHSTPQYTESGVRFVSVENIDNLYASTKFISEEAYEKFKIKPQIGDVFMTRIGTMGKCAIVNSDEPLGYYVSLALLRPNKNVLSSEYLRWYLESGSGWKELESRTLWNATPIKINKGEIGKMKIKVPSLSEQKRIVEQISAYYEVKTELLNLLSQEIVLRKKQYEYYRDKLLTFKELGA